MTRKEINDFFSEIETQLKNKKKLYDDIRKLNSKNDSKSKNIPKILIIRFELQNLFKIIDFNP